MEGVKVDFFGKDPRVQKAINLSRNLSVMKAPVLITGEVGVGKRSLGIYIHENSPRNGQPLEIVDCSQPSEDVINKILGYRDDETGKFFKGALEKANGGSVIFANIEGLEEDFQKRLHTILGELEDYDIDVRVIATTTKNLSKLVGSGRFYRGLYTVFSNNNISLPPLRERTSDLKYLAQNFVDSNITINDEAMDKILSHYWTHNIHELKTVLESSLENCEGETLKETDVEIGEKRSVNFSTDEDGEGIRLMSLKEAERLLIKKALIHTSENRTQAAKILGVSIRTLRNKINEYRSTGKSYFVNLR